jgi:3-methyl-2-oxobutanoate hydroxymethyltransferase
LKNQFKAGNGKTTTADFAKRKREGLRIPTLSLYDAVIAKIANSCGVDLLLVGDSLGMTVLGYKNTIPVTVDDVLRHAAAVRRGAETAFVVADMPFMSYQISPEQAMKNAARFLQEAGSDGVKIEGGKAMACTIKRLVNAGVPVMAHIGLLPQNILIAGGYKKRGKTDSDRKELLEDAKVVEDAGAFSVVLECIEDEAAAQITQTLAIPTIGIGSGNSCDGQIQVINDILGLFTDFIPKHAKPYLSLSSDIKNALSSYVSDVLNRNF